MSLPVSHRTSGIDASIELYDSDIKAIMEGPMEWFNIRTGSMRVVDDVHKGLVEQFEKIGFRVDVQLSTFGECHCKPECRSAEACRHLVPMTGSYMFQVMINSRINQESSFDFDRQVHEVQRNLLQIPGEGGTIKFDEKEFMRKQRENGHGHRH